ncbi:MAG: hypothetical protein JRF63_04790 [Deltaproteobacteria bacterium]|nr:hypothetical protein [Deltaproteobacteria bacterium]
MERNHARPHYSITALLLAGILVVACGSGDDEGSGLEGGEITVSAEREQAMCDDLNSNPSTAPLPKTAGTAIGEGGAINAASGKKVIDFVDFEGHNGGYIRLAIDPANQSAVFLMLDTDVGFAAVHEDGTEVDYLESGNSSELCPETDGRYLWIVKDSENHLRFGPTSASSVDLVIETLG